MRLEIGNFHVKDVVFGDKTEYAAGVLTINKEEAIAFLRNEDERLLDVDLQIAKPGDAVRIVPVKEAIEVRCKIDAGNLFPGVLSPLELTGHGRTHALKGCSVLVVGKHWGGFQDGLIDMSGPGAPYTIYSQLINICLVGDTTEEFERKEVQKKNHALRWAGMRLAEYLGRTLKSLQPEETELYELPPVAKRPPKLQALPAVVYVMQLQSQMEEDGYNALVYGWDANHMLPTYMHPNELLDGAIISGSFMPCSSKISTWEHVNNATIKRLYREHGRTLNFLGVITSNLNVNLEEKTRSALVVRQLAQSLGADGAIVCEEGYGNPDADFIAVIDELEKAGIKTVGLTNECTGRDGASQPLVALSERANALVTTGNVSQLIELPPMPKIIGELEALARDGLSGGWPGCVKDDGSVIMENNSMFCADANTGIYTKKVVEY